MIHPGLCSITFRELSQRQIVDLVAEAGLAGIEWGGDIHCPHGDTGSAAQAGAMTRDAGLAVSSYGSYYRAGRPVEGKDTPPFGAALASAVAMEAPLIRIWAGGHGSDAAEASEAHRAEVADDTRRIADLAASVGVRIAFEYHAGSLTDTLESALRLLAAIDRDNVGCYWQPPFGAAKSDNLTAIEALADKLANVHVFCWQTAPGDKIDHRPLAEGQGDWTDYFAEIAAVPGDRWALLEFVRDGSEDHYRRDAATLRKWLAGQKRS